MPFGICTELILEHTFNILGNSIRHKSNFFRNLLALLGTYNTKYTIIIHILVSADFFQISRFFLRFHVVVFFFSSVRKTKCRESKVKTT